MLAAIDDHSQATAEAPDASGTGVPASEVEAKLLGLRGAPPSYASELMLRHKGIHYRRTNLIPGRHPRSLARRGFSGRTVPVMTLNGRRVQTNRAIARALDELVPEPPLFPRDPGQRARVEEAERFTDEVLQHATRRMILWSLTRDPRSVNPHPALGKLLIPRIRWLRNRLMQRAFDHYGISDEVVREHFDALPGWLDRLDGYIAGGVLGAEELNAADYQTAPLVAALAGIHGHGDEIPQRPAGELLQVM